jgi:hypothetical protein
MALRPPSHHQLPLTEHVDKQQVDCLNQSSQHPVANIFTNDDSYLESDCDEQASPWLTYCAAPSCCRRLMLQLIINIGFRQPVRLSGLHVVAKQKGKPVFANRGRAQMSLPHAADEAPKTIKIYVNRSTPLVRIRLAAHLFRAILSVNIALHALLSLMRLGLRQYGRGGADDCFVAIGCHCTVLSTCTKPSGHTYSAEDRQVPKRQHCHGKSHIYSYISRPHPLRLLVPKS